MWISPKNITLSEKKKPAKNICHMINFTYVNFKTNKPKNILMENTSLYIYIYREQNCKNICGNHTNQFGYLP